MGKIGRNAPCPCGSGKKFKKCCLNKPAKGRSIRTIHWDREEVQQLSTEEIIQRLRGFGVDFTKGQFLEDTRRFYSACDLADHWKDLYPIIAEGFDKDFIWMAAIVLWERWAPGVINSEMLDDLMQEGYDLLEKDPLGACNRWLEVWEHLKKRFTPDMKSIADAEQIFSGSQLLI